MMRIATDAQNTSAFSAKDRCGGSIEGGGQPFVVAYLDGFGEEPNELCMFGDVESKEQLARLLEGLQAEAKRRGWV